MKKFTPSEMKDLIVEVLTENKATDILAIDITKLTEISDYMIVCTATSVTHVRSLIEKTRKNLLTFNIKPLGIEGEETDWMLIDFGDVIVHAMMPSVRELYDLESLWDIKKIINKQD